jgi:hypothetical protein
MEAYIRRIGYYATGLKPPQRWDDITDFLKAGAIPRELGLDKRAGQVSRAYRDVEQFEEAEMGIVNNEFVERRWRRTYAELFRQAAVELIQYVRNPPPPPTPEEETFPMPIPLPPPVRRGRGVRRLGDSYEQVRGDGLRAVSCSCGRDDLRGGGFVADLATAAKTMNDLKPILDAAQQEYDELVQYEPEMLEAQGLTDRLRDAITTLNTYVPIYRAAYEKYMRTLPKLDKQQLKEYKKRLKDEFKMSKEEREVLANFKRPKPLRTRQPIPEEDETPEMERQNAREVGEGKRVTFARKYLRGRGIRATKGNVRKVLDCMDVEGVVFES